LVQGTRRKDAANRSHHRDEHAIPDSGMIVYDALYAWLRTASTETHYALLFRKP
jgi:hypothetical protein